MARTGPTLPSPPSRPAPRAAWTRARRRTSWARRPSSSRTTWRPTCGRRCGGSTRTSGTPATPTCGGT
eukprot:354811-Alexandrium_andersonii.AAC.1